MDAEIIRTLRPFSDLKTPNNTIYDHLPYKKDITLVKESDVRLISGNIVKGFRLVSEEPILINTNPLANERIEKYLNELSSYEENYAVEEFHENELLDENSEVTANVPVIEPINSFAGVDEDDGDYSFLLD